MKIFRIADTCICCGSRALCSSPAVLMPFVAKRVFGHDPVEITADWGLRDLKPGTSYMPCHSLQCLECRVLFLDYRFTDEQMDALYRDYRGAAYTQERDHYEPGYAATLARDYRHRHSYLAEVEDWLAPHLPEQPVVLDWGGGDGSNALFLGRGRVDVHDISGVPTVEGAQPASADHARGSGYDLVACSQVLEHVPEPLSLLQQILPMLSPHTLLYVEVPREALVREHPGSLVLASRKRYWHEHVNFFTEASLHRLLDIAGIRVVDMRHLELDNGVRKGEVFCVLGRLAA